MGISGSATRNYCVEGPNFVNKKILKVQETHFLPWRERQLSKIVGMQIVPT